MVLVSMKSLAILSPSGAAYFDGTTGTWKEMLIHRSRILTLILSGNLRHNGILG